MKNTINLIFLILYIPLTCQSFAYDKLIVASFHPILSDFANNIGENNVKIISVMKPGDDPHKYKPDPNDLKKVSNAKIILFMGKNLEFYLPEIKDFFKNDQIVLEVGNYVPSLELQIHNDLHKNCNHHINHMIDPHWWHSINNAIKAIRIIYLNFSKLDPKNSKTYKKNYKNYKEQLEKLNLWGKKTINNIPRKDRILCTSHSAFGYFCNDFGFKSIPIQGLTSEQNPNPKYLRKVINIIKNENIKVAFPEKYINPKIIKTLVNEANIKLGPSLIAGTPKSYIQMLKYNITAITKTFKECN